jgi:hypothetical protein
MRRSLPAFLLLALLPTAVPLSTAAGREPPGPRLVYLPGSSVKIEQVIGDKDWADWATGTLTPTASQTVTRADVLGNGLGYSFEHEGKLIFLFGDTIGASDNYVPKFYPTVLDGDFKWEAREPMAWSASSDPGAPLQLTFFQAPDGSPLPVQPLYPTPQTFPDGTFGTALPMGADNIPASGISVEDRIYVVCTSGADETLNDPQRHEYSVLTRFDEAAGTFTAGRTLSHADAGGHFIIMSIQDWPPLPGAWNNSGSEGSMPLNGEPGLLLFGLGSFRATDAYLACIPARQFWSGVDPKGQPATRYLTGIDDQGRPLWSDQETAAAPLGLDTTMGNLSVVYAPELGLWLMTYDGGRQTDATTGIYFTFASEPWGPWAPPQLIFNATRDHGFGQFIHFYDPTQPSVPGYGPAGPTIGANPPETTRGGTFAPQMIGRFLRVKGDTLTIQYTMSTWNPYTVVRMRSAFRILRPSHGDPPSSN